MTVKDIQKELDRFDCKLYLITNLKRGTKYYLLNKSIPLCDVNLLVALDYLEEEKHRLGVLEVNRGEEGQLNGPYIITSLAYGELAPPEIMDKIKKGLSDGSWTKGIKVAKQSVSSLYKVGEKVKVPSRNRYDYYFVSSYRTGGYSNFSSYGNYRLMNSKGVFVSASQIQKIL